MFRVAEHFEKSDTGRQRRANEDSYFARAPLFVVADGMGGAQAGEVASRVAVDTLGRGLPDGSGPAQDLLAARVEEANEAIHDLSRRDADRAGMGTTTTAVYVGEEEAAIAHVGDSRAYRLRDGELQRLTEDHSLVEELMRQGKLTAQEASEHPQKSIITRALGPEPVVEVDRQTVRLRDGDVFLICSDGLTGMVGEDFIEDVLRSSADLRAAGQTLVTAANDAGGRDNITVVLFRIEDVSAAGAGDADTSSHELPATSVATDAGASTRTHAAVAAPTATAAPPAPRSQPRTPHARRPVTAQTRRRRGMPGWAKATVLALCILVPILIGGWFASQSVYFIGTDGQGRVTLYRGVPYDLPAGLHLYSPEFVTGVTAAELPAVRRRQLLDHQLRSHDDGFDLIRQVDSGSLTG